MDNLTEEQREKYRIAKKETVIINWFRDRRIIKYFDTDKYNMCKAKDKIYKCPFCKIMGTNHAITYHIIKNPQHIEYIYDNCFEDDKKTLLQFVDLYNDN